MVMSEEKFEDAVLLACSGKTQTGQLNQRKSGLVRPSRTVLHAYLARFTFISSWDSSFCFFAIFFWVFWAQSQREVTFPLHHSRSFERVKFSFSRQVWLRDFGGQSSVDFGSITHSFHESIFSGS